MNQITLQKEDRSGLTGVSNLFIDTFMRDANDAQIKTYLYLLRAQNAGLPIRISEIADSFNHTEKEIIRSLRYWEKQKLLSLQVDENNEIAGIRLLEVPGQEQPKTLAPIVSLLPAEKPEPVRENAAPAKPSYSADDLRKFKDKEEFSALLCIIEQYLGKPLSPTDVKSILYIYDGLQFSTDLIDSLLEYCLERGKKELRYIEKTAIGWYEQGIRTLSQAHKNTETYDKNIYTVMNALGKGNHTPTAKEVDYINRWIGAYGFSMNMILECCERTVMATENNRFQYAEGILSKWREQNLFTPDRLEKAEAAYRRNKAAAQKTSSENSFNRFTKTTYDFEALERELLSN
ncbi:MAG: DnaD domain protein [Lachnospiraceae bacterium]|nr:DnaD domain protein [Lachnospiraceae bacterium]